MKQEVPVEPDSKKKEPPDTGDSLQAIECFDRISVRWSYRLHARHSTSQGELPR